MRIAFYCMEIREQDKEKIAFSVNHRHLEHNRVIMGLRNIGAILSQLMNKVFSKLYGGSIIFLLVIFLCIAKHSRNICVNYGKPYKDSQTGKLSLNPDKCEFVKFSVEYLDHNIYQCKWNFPITW